MQKTDPTKPIPVFRIVIGLSNTVPGVLYSIQEMFGGDICVSNRKKATHHKTVWAWKVSGREVATRFLLAIEPYVIVKKEQVKLGLEYLETVGPMGHRINKENWDIRLHVYEKLQETNRAGYDRPTPPIPKDPKTGLKPKTFYSSEELSKRMAEMRAKRTFKLADNPSYKALKAREYRAKNKAAANIKV